MKRLLLVMLVMTIIISPSLALLPGGGGTYTNGTVINITTSDTVAHYQDQLNLILSNETGVNTAGSLYHQGIVYTNGTTRPDWRDINFTTFDGNTKLSFYIWNNTQTLTTVNVTVLLPSSVTSSVSQIALYYNNSLQTSSVQDGYGTFPILFDDFSIGTLNTSTWVGSTGSPTLTFSDGYVKITSSSGTAGMWSNAVSQINTTIFTKMNASSITGINTLYYAPTDSSPLLSGNSIYIGFGSNPAAYRNYNGATTSSPLSGLSAGTQYVFGCARNNTGAYWTTNAGTTPVYLTGNYMTTSGNVSFATGSSSLNFYEDWIFAENHSAEYAPMAVGYASISTVSGSAPVASFSQNTTGGAGSTSVQFTDTSTNTPTVWNWSFTNVTGNNTPVYFSTSRNPVHTFNFGNYSIALNVSNAYGYNISTQSTWINVSSGVPISSFTADVYNGTTPLTVQFNDTSSNIPTAWNWSFQDVFGNNTQTWWSQLQNSTLTFPNAGNYTVVLNASNAYGYNISTQSTWINISSAVSPVASFTYAPTSGTIPLAVSFTDTSQSSITAWNWTFGAAPNFSSLQNPSYTFVGAGNYSVKLSVTNASGTNSTTKYVLVNSITDPNPNSMIKYKTSRSIVNIDNQTPYVGTGVIRNISSNTTQVISNFTWNPAYVSISNIRINQSSVNITGLSIDSYAIHNDLGYAIVNESKASGFVAPANATFDFNITYIKYAAPGTSIPFSFDSSSEYYDVANSTYWNFNTITGANAVIGVWGPIGANFSANATTVAVGSPLAFSDTSTGYPDAWSWDFGDGSTSPAQNPVYSYATTGLKTVALYAYMSENGTITNTITKTNYINVTAAPPPAPVADFTGTPTTVSLGTTVQFNDTSAYSPTSWSWNFGDSGGSSLQNPTHLYTSIGVYNVSLTATNAQGSSTATKTNYINVTALAPPVASFTSNVTSGGIPLPVQFTDTTSNTPTSWLWTFGDTGATSTSQNPSHTFTTQGNWSVSLKATNAAGNNTVTHYINATTLSGFTRQDLVMAPQYTLTINFVDSSTNNPIPVVKVVNAADGTSVNTTTGTYTGTFGYTTAVLYCYSDGYAAKSVSYIMTGGRTETVQLTQSTTSQTQNTNVVYSPTMVQFLFYNENLKTISNAYVIATPINFTAPSNWTSLLLGISSGCNILGTSVYGWTDVAGSWSAPMVASVDYSMTVAGTEGGTPFNYTFTTYPVQSPVHITLPIGITAMPTPSQISYGLNHTAVNTTMQTVVMNYYDPSGETTILNFYITNTTGALLASGNYTGSSANSASFYQNITVATRGQAYTYGFTANQGTLGWINRSDSFVDPSFSLLGSGFTPGVVELWFSIALLVIFGAVGSFYFKHIILIAEPILYWFIASYLSWLPLNTNVYFSLAVMLVLGVLIYIRYRENMIQ